MSIDLSAYSDADLEQLAAEVNAERLRRSVVVEAPKRAAALVHQVAEEDGDPATVVQAAQAAVDALAKGSATPTTPRR